MTTLETNRLLLRAWEEKDAPDLNEYAANPLMSDMVGWSAHKNMEETEAVLADFRRNGELFAIVLKETGKVIGSIGFYHRDPEDSTVLLPHRELAFALSPDYREEGLAQEAVDESAKYAFEELGLGVLWCGHDVDDPFSPQVLDDCGFTFRFEHRVKRAFSAEKRMKYYYALTRQTYLADRQGEDGIESLITTMF